MTGQIAALCRRLGAQEEEALLQAAAGAAQLELRRALRPGVTPEDCGDAFPLAAALLTRGLLEQLSGAEDVTAFTAGEVTIRRTGRGNPVRRARVLLSPWLADPGFCVREVEG